MKVGVTTLSRICRLQTRHFSIHNVKAIVAVCCRIHLTVFVNVLTKSWIIWDIQFEITLIVLFLLPDQEKYFVKMKGM